MTQKSPSNEFLYKSVIKALNIDGELKGLFNSDLNPKGPVLSFNSKAVYPEIIVNLDKWEWLTTGKGMLHHPDYTKTFYKFFTEWVFKVCLQNNLDFLALTLVFRNEGTYIKTIRTKDYKSFNDLIYI